jgi:hypothetical protein
MPPRYTSLGSTYRTILTQEGLFRGLYSGVLPALIGSFGGTMIFFGSYELTKRSLIDHLHLPPSIAYFTAGVVADVAASPLYVPSEVLKTRLQLQGRYNNRHFPESGYNYRGTADALRSIVRAEGLGALFYGYQATLYRDVPFSALQFLFYEQERRLAKRMVGDEDIGLALEIGTGASAGCLAGVITCPLDVVKTRIQTQVVPAGSGFSLSAAAQAGSHTSSTATKPTSTPQTRHISTSSPSTTMIKPYNTATLDTSSVVTGLKIIYRTEGALGLFRGVGPRAIWTSVQSGCMFLMYQTFLKYLDGHPLV